MSVKLDPVDRPPPPPVLQAFGAERPARPVLGGTRAVWRSGDAVFKAVDATAAEVAWERRVLRAAASDGLRVAAPLPSRDGRLLVAGWVAYPYLAGETTTRWRDVAMTGDRLHAALADEPRPDALLDRRRDPWARADRAAWGDAEPVTGADDEVIVALLAAREPVELPDQLVHGDLAGNVLWEPRRPPAVLDLSPYWRPADWGLAIAAVDLVTWHGGGETPLDEVAERPEGVQLLLRAVLFRLLVAGDRTRLADTAEAILERVDA